mmetsp:Transcript_67717/g.181106  ORF Transcript_67717/g.181106 Transcript_67717/m.181106 type:complete len:143 (-) Transcript_67717:333-761(-)
MFIYYEEKRVRSMQAQLSKLKLEFRRALFQGRHDLEVELSVKLNRLTADIVAGHIKIMRLKKDSMRMDADITPVWTFLRWEAQGGSVSTTVESFRVRTSDANLAAWGGVADRLMENPRAWNNNMESEAEEYASGLNLDDEDP